MKKFDIVILLIIALFAIKFFMPKKACKFMRIYSNEAGDAIALAEVKAITPGGMDAAQNGATAIQTSTNTAHLDASASKAIDGNYDGEFHNGSVSHTLPGVGEYWQLNIIPTVIAEVVIANRSDTATERLGGATLVLYDEKSKEFFRATLADAPLQSIYIK